ncbi:MAG: ABC transporter [Novosphingobium sp.]
MAVKRKAVLLAATIAALAVAAAVVARRHGASDSAAIGLFTTLPILWNEEPDVGAMLKSDAAPHWARALLAARGTLTAFDRLAAPGGAAPLARTGRLVMAQPRPLGPDENVALDDWVNGGGHVLLLADPALTAESNFAVGDPRRPQAVVLLSPILKRWGLDLRFDEAQPYGDRTVRIGSTALPVNLAGHFAVRTGGTCTLDAGGVLALCRIGRGRVTALADAAVLDRDDPDGSRAAAFAALIDRAFAD